MMFAPLKYLVFFSCFVTSLLHMHVIFYVKDLREKYARDVIQRLFTCTFIQIRM